MAGQGNDARSALASFQSPLVGMLSPNTELPMDLPRDLLIENSPGRPQLLTVIIVVLRITLGTKLLRLMVPNPLCHSEV